MEVYVLDSLYRRIRIIGTYESFAWTERYSAYGDFVLELQSTRDNRLQFLPGTNITHSETLRVGTVETVEDATDAEGREMLSLKGRTVERILDQRAARGSMTDTTTNPKWVLEGLPGEILRQMFHDICVTGVLDPGDVIPSITEGSSLFPADNIPEPEDEIVYEVDPMTLYKATKDLADIFRMGFRIVRGPDNGQLYYDIYTGIDRTSKQDDVRAVIFSPSLDNLQNTKELSTITLYRNVAYVFSPVGFEVVYPLDVDPDVAGFERSVLVVNATDITDEDGPTASAKMIQRGLEELAKNRRFSAFDGEINQNSMYKYGRDYNLGDYVEKRNSTGTTADMLVTEQIFTSDSQGDRSFPTLEIVKFITVGSWAAWESNQEWAEVDPSEHWADQP